MAAARTKALVKGGWWLCLEDGLAFHDPPAYALLACLLLILAPTMHDRLHVHVVLQNLELSSCFRTIYRQLVLRPVR